MRKYETLLLISPDLTVEAQAEILATLQAIIIREQGKTLYMDDWGVKDLAYPVNKYMRGHYIRLEYAAPGNCVAELERQINITDGVWKFVTVQLSENFVETPEVAEVPAEAPAEPAAPVSESAESVSETAEPAAPVEA